MTTFLQLVVGGLGPGAAYALVGIGLTLVFRTTGIINFAQGALAVIAGLVAASLATHLPIVLSAIIGVAVATVVGMLMGVIAIGRRDRTTALASLVITIGLAFLAEAVELIIFGDTPRSYAAISSHAWSLGGVLVQPQYALILGLAIISAAALGVVIRYTNLGHAFVACSDSRRAAELVGLNVRVLGTASFALAGLLGAVAGIALTPIVAMQFDSDVGITVNAFAAAVFGGLVSIPGAFAGGLVLGVSESLVSGYVSAQYNLAIALVLMLVVLIVRAGREPVVEA